MSDTYIDEPNLPEELEKLQEQLALEEKVKQLQDVLEDANKAKTSLEYKLEQSRNREVQLGKRIIHERKNYEKARLRYEQELAEAAVKQAKSIVWPCVLVAVFGALSLLVGLCVDKGWMVALLGELLICAFLCVCTFFAGIVWCRTKR